MQDPSLSLVHGIPLAEEPGRARRRSAATCARSRRAMARARRWSCATASSACRWSYDELLARSIEVARALIACGVGKDARVGILMTNRPEFLAALFGTALAGGVPVALSTFSTPPELGLPAARPRRSRCCCSSSRCSRRTSTPCWPGSSRRIAAGAPGALASDELSRSCASSSRSAACTAAASRSTARPAARSKAGTRFLAPRRGRCRCAGPGARRCGDARRHRRHLLLLGHDQPAQGHRPFAARLRRSSGGAGRAVFVHDASRCAPGPATASSGRAMSRWWSARRFSTGGAVILQRYFDAEEALRADRAGADRLHQRPPAPVGAAAGGAATGRAPISPASNTSRAAS